MIQLDRLTKKFSDFKTGERLGHLITSASMSNPAKSLDYWAPMEQEKTTCLRILSTVLKPSSGSAIIAGYDVATPSRSSSRPHRLHVE